MQVCRETRLVLAVVLACSGCRVTRVPGNADPPPPVLSLRATGHDRRIDLAWQSQRPGFGYHVYRSPSRHGSFTRRTTSAHKRTVFSDFVGLNGRRLYYRISSVDAEGRESAQSGRTSATTRAMNDDDLLQSVQQATFRYFWDHAHPVSGLARERDRSRDVCTTGGTGFGLMAIMVGAERGFVGRREAARRILKVVTFLGERVTRYHGAWSHWVNGRTGATVPFSRYDDGGDIVETAFLVQGLLTVRQYFDRGNEVERELRRRATALWREVEWSWYLREPDGRRLTWHWSPNHGWRMNHRIGGRFNECMIVYLLAIASPTHPIPPECYYEGWVGDPDTYANGGTFYGIRQWVGNDRGGPLFFTHYSFLGFDPRGKRDRFCNYFKNNRNITLINRAYCITNPGEHEGYSQDVWGLTASDTPGGYRAHAPGRTDNGTITPTAAISSMPYAPRESMAALRHMYVTLGDKLWGEFGFRDAFNLDQGWFAPSYLAIDQGPIICMIENYRSGLCWRMFMRNTEIPAMLQAIGWQPEWPDGTTGLKPREDDGTGVGPHADPGT